MKGEIVNRLFGTIVGEMNVRKVNVALRNMKLMRSALDGRLLPEELEKLFGIDEIAQ